MRLIFWVTALAVLSVALAKNSTAKTKPKRQLESIRTPQSLQYSLVLPHSRVTHFRSLTSERRISHPNPRGKLPPYAVQMEPVVQYSQKDPLYDPSQDNLDEAVNENALYAQPKILNVQDQASEGSYGPPYGVLPTAPLYSQDAHPHPHYYEAPEPIIEIIIRESNETLPAPPPPPVLKKKKEPVHVFYVKYSKDPHNKDKVVYEKPVPAITPPTNEEEEDHHHHHHEEYVTVTPEPYIHLETTTLRAIIKPESEVYHSDSSVKITFGNEGRHYSDRRESSHHNEDHEETAPRPAIAYPQQGPIHPPLERSVSPSPQEPRQHEVRRQENVPRPANNHPTALPYRPVSQNAQSRIQFQPSYLTNEQQLPRQGPSLSPFRAQGHIPRQNPFNQQSFNANPTFPSGLASPSTNFASIAPTVPGPIGPVFPSSFPRPNNGPAFHVRPSNQPPFAIRPHFNGPQRPPSFHSGPQRPFHQPQAQQFFDEAKYLQENYHTITTDQIDPSKDQSAPNRAQSSFHPGPRPSPSPIPGQFQEHLNRPQIIPLNQQLPQQRPPQHFTDPLSKPTFNINPSGSPFFNLKPSPPHIEGNRVPFQQPQQQFSFHQGVQPLSRPSVQVNSQHNLQFSPSPSPSPAPIPQHQFLPQPSSPPLFNNNAQPSQTPEQQHQYHQFAQPHSPSERPQFQHSQGPSERPPIQNNFHDQSNIQHQQNVGQFVPKGGELVSAISKYEQHITVNGPTAQPSYNGFRESNQPSPSPSQEPNQQYQQQQIQQQQQLQHQQKQQQQLQQQQQHQQQQQQQQQQHLQQQQQQSQQQQQQLQQSLYDPEQEQVRLQLAQNVQKQQEEIRRLQNQLLIAQQQHQTQQNQEQYLKNYEQQSRNNYKQEQVQASTPKSQYSQKPRQQASFTSSSPAPPYHSHYQSTTRTVEIKPTTPKYVSSTVNSISPNQGAKKEEKKNRPTISLPDEVPDDLRQQLLSSGILDNADISILDYDKVGDTPLDSLPPDQLANFFSAGGGQQIAASESRPIVVSPSGDRIQSRIDDQDEEDDQEIAASENVATYAVPPPTQKQAVEMKIVHFDPKTAEGQKIAKDYVKDDATQVDPVTLNDKKYNRYLPLKVSGNQFPLPDILKGRKITSVVVLAPVETEALNHIRSERAATTTENLKGIKFIAGESLQDLLKRPTKDNFEKWLDTEKKTATDLQSVVLLVTGDNELTAAREIYMYDISSGKVNKLSGDLSNAFVDAAENNALSKDIEKLAIEGKGTPENFDRDSTDDDDAEASDNVPFLIDLSGVSLDDENSNQVSISSGYSKTKHGRSLQRH